jgi:hypothetical protein
LAGDVLGPSQTERAVGATLAWARAL